MNNYLSLFLNSIPENIVLADPKFNIQSKIDILICAVHFFEIFGVQKYILCPIGQSLIS